MKRVEGRRTVRLWNLVLSLHQRDAACAWQLADQLCAAAGVHLGDAPAWAEQRAGVDAAEAGSFKSLCEAVRQGVRATERRDACRAKLAVATARDLAAVEDDEDGRVEVKMLSANLRKGLGTFLSVVGGGEAAAAKVMTAGDRREKNSGRRRR